MARRICRKGLPVRRALIGQREEASVPASPCNSARRSCEPGKEPEAFWNDTGLWCGMGRKWGPGLTSEGGRGWSRGQEEGCGRREESGLG